MLLRTSEVVRFLIFAGAVFFIGVVFVQQPVPKKPREALLRNAGIVQCILEIEMQNVVPTESVIRECGSNSSHCSNVSSIIDRYYGGEASLRFFPEFISAIQKRDSVILYKIGVPIASIASDEFADEFTVFLSNDFTWSYSRREIDEMVARKKSEIDTYLSRVAP